jgi:heptosyltransferase-2
LPLVVRLPNWVGNVVQAIATLQLLQQHGYQLHLVGKTWTADLLAGYDWPIHRYPGSSSAAIAQLWRLRRQLQRSDPGFGTRINMLLLTDSHRSAMEAGLAGMRSLGYRRNMRSHYLRQGLRRLRGLHAVQEYWLLGSALLDEEVPQQASHIEFAFAAKHTEEAIALRQAHRIADRYAVLCPFSGAGQTSASKRWPGFAELVRWLQAQGIPMVLCPGPGEVQESERSYPMALTLPSVSLGAYGALMRDAWCTIANDTGPGHIAAASGARLVSICGPHFNRRWTPLGRAVTLIHNPERWPTVEEVTAQLPSRPAYTADVATMGYDRAAAPH